MLTIVKTAGTYATGLGLAVTTRSDETAGTVGVQRLADELDRETISMFIDELDHFQRFGPSLDAKKADTAFNDSFVSRSS
ncbi:hypothetical protein [Corynebacterium ulcerans]|uniref:hypothetical protein n=1 Tax=Corynebacterium ulcerans TaxID=65058 RepID=UPI000CACEE3C|nr:hypothetical protein [Corynebacterium ulcerans]MBH5297577.1 hypothetical protein [Corynebacterium ulcerans]MBH5302968.1 hypothetical protein [Corynebacterium ulcerans]PLV99089.1 hypothetical protein BRL53_07630 [Corynebacterium ulcerans]